MSEEAPAGGSAAPAPETPAAAQTGGEASAALGNAPGGGVDAIGGEATPVEPAVAPTPKFTFAGRDWTSQKHAEDAYKANLGRNWESKLTEAQRAIAERDAELQALRGLLVPSGGGGRGQGVTGGREAPGGPQTFPDELARSGALDTIARIAEDPEIGFKGAVYEMARLFDERLQSQVQQLRTEAIEPIVQRNEKAQVVAKAFGAVSKLVADYPELDEKNTSEEAEAAQQAILQTIQSHPQGPQWLASDPERALRWAAEEVRRQYGTPVFAQPPGTSGAPSGLAAQAAEAAASKVAASPLDGSGVPRQRASGQPETFADRIRRENREIQNEVTTPSGRRLGFSA